MADPYIVDKSGIKFFETDTVIVTFTKPSPPRRVLTSTTTNRKAITGDDPHGECVDTKHFDLVAQPWGTFKVSLFEVVQRSSVFKVVGWSLLAIGGVALIATGIGALAGSALVVTSTGGLTALGSTGVALGAGGLAGGGAILKGEVTKDYTTGDLVMEYEKDIPLDPNELVVGHEDESGGPYRCP
jgi:hypothetical protein